MIKETVVEGVCTWTQDGPGKWQTECGNTRFVYIKDFPQPKIRRVNGADICPWCGKVIKYEEEEEEG